MDSTLQASASGGLAAGVIDGLGALNLTVGEVSVYAIEHP